jgi:hypothetical protein
MAKKATPSANKKNSLRYLVVYKDKKDSRISGDFAMVETLDLAQKSKADVQEESKRAEPDRPIVEDSFAAIQMELSSAVARHRALDKVMAMLGVTAVDIQFAFAVGPTLKKHATLVEDGGDRMIYSFDRASARDVIVSIREAASGVSGIGQLPRLLLIGLVSEYDVFLRKLIKVGLATQVGLLSRVDRSLTLKELAEFSTIEEASEYLVEKEIDAILYKDHHEQLTSIGKLFNASIDTKQECVKNFLEICERRNLFTHNAGFVNARYLNKCREYEIKTDAKVGRELSVNSEYFRQAMISIQELSIRLTQFLWRKLIPSEHDAADEQINQTAFELLRGDDYLLAERILDYALHHTTGSRDLMRRMMVVNYANAIKLGGNQAKADAELDKFDWSATSIEFQISVAAVRGDVKAVLKLLPAAAKSGKVKEENARTWPVFKIMRGEKSFQDAFREIFKSDLITVKVASTVVSASSGGEVKTLVKSGRSKGIPTRH